jgi:hypothetical protein
MFLDFWFAIWPWQISAWVSIWDFWQWWMQPLWAILEDLQSIGNSLPDARLLDF